MKQKTLIPLIVFLLGICLVGIILYKVDSHETAQNHTTALLNATTYGERIKNEITNGIEITDALKQVLISEDGEINHFDTIAENLMSDSIESVQLAPDGVVTDIYPAEGNEAGKIDLLHDKDRGKDFLLRKRQPYNHYTGTIRIETGRLWNCCPQSHLPEGCRRAGVFLGIYHCYPACS